jgi:hypothetical protein
MSLKASELCSRARRTDRGPLRGWSQSGSEHPQSVADVSGHRIMIAQICFTSSGSGVRLPVQLALDATFDDRGDQFFAAADGSSERAV